jgi:hypothetical protein
MHIHPFILVKADNIDEAKSQAESFIEDTTEQRLIDYGSVVEGKIKPLCETIAKVRKAKGLHRAYIQDNLDNARAMEEKGNSSMRGYYLKKAGELLGEEFCKDANVFNIDECLGWNYHIPNDDDLNGWYSVVINYHV